MGERFFFWLISFIPWEIWAVLAGIAVGVIKAFVGSWRIAIAIGLVIAAVGFSSRVYNYGWQDRDVKAQQEIAILKKNPKAKLPKARPTPRISQKTPAPELPDLAPKKKPFCPPWIREDRRAIVCNE